METYLIWRNERDDTLDIWWADFLAEKKHRFSTGIVESCEVLTNTSPKIISLRKLDVVLESIHILLLRLNSWNIQTDFTNRFTRFTFLKSL